ncbi:SDR family NAD(P)-dependent oxidoreductase, partial [Acinetobacter baumannii]
AHLVEQGAKVILVDMNQEQGNALQQQLGEQAEFVQLDVTDEQAVEAFFNHVENKYGQLNGLVNCAGIAPSAKVLGRNGIHE